MNRPATIRHSIPIQIEGFLALVQAVNEIPHVHIPLNQSRDPQREALAFVVDTIYRQFKEENWPLVLQKLPDQVREWNTPKNAVRATSSLLKFIQHLFDYRIAEIKQHASTEGEKEWAEGIRILYQTTTSSILKQAEQDPKDQPVNIGGIPQSLLPEWYVNKKYLEPIHPKKLERFKS